MNQSFQQILAFFMLISILPLIFIVSIIIFIQDGSPVFYRQKRVGQNNKTFSIYKFRTMLKDTPDIPTHLTDNVLIKYTKTGLFMRKYSIDEIPQIINIIKNEMAFIGPRPALYNQDDLIKLRTEAKVHMLCPGITGWAQINGRDEINITDKVSLDKYYLKNQSFWFDIKILFMTIYKVVNKKNISH